MGERSPSHRLSKKDVMDPDGAEMNPVSKGDDPITLLEERESLEGGRSAAARAAAVSLAHSFPWAVIACCITMTASGCPSFMSIWPPWTRALLMLVITLVFVITGVVIGASIICCPTRCACCKIAERTCLYSAALPWLIAIVLVSVPATGTRYIQALTQEPITGLTDKWKPPSGYCEDANAQTEWLSGFGGLEQGSAAFEARLAALVANMTEDEKVLAPSPVSTADRRSTSAGPLSHPALGLSHTQLWPSLTPSSGLLSHPALGLSRQLCRCSPTHHDPAA
jgi:hypothetical protein